MHINYGRIHHFQTCPRLYYWRFVENLAPPRSATPLIIGKSFHDGLAALYSGRDPSAFLSEAFTKVRDQEKWLKPELEELDKQQEYVRYMMEQYQITYEKEPWTVLAPEVEGSIKMGSHQLHFRTDAVIEWRNALWLLEHKTTSQLGPSFFKKFLMDGQITTYIYAVWGSLGTRPLGAVINAICKSRTLNKVTFERDVIMRSEAQINEFVEQACRQCTIIEGLNPIKDDFLMHTSQCVRFNRTCEFMDLCLHDTPQHREFFSRREPDYVDEPVGD